LPRLFVAIAMPDEVEDACDRFARGFPDARWTELDDLHLTLRFIGAVEHSAFYEIGEALAHVSLPPFELRLAGIGQFPPRGPLRQLWIGVSANAGLDRLRRRIDRCVLEAGLPPERRKFVPHVTLARFLQPPPEREVASYLQRHSLLRLPPFPVDSFGLYSSILRAERAEHVLEAEYNFVTGSMRRE
jgi:RNA 2',3'-cyclic 3'-phosphodiesterase